LRAGEVFKKIGSCPQITTMETGKTNREAENRERHSGKTGKLRFWKSSKTKEEKKKNLSGEWQPSKQTTAKKTKQMHKKV